MRGLAAEGSRQPRDPDRREAGAERRDYRLGIAGVLLGASLPGAGLPLGEEPPMVLPVSGDVGGAVGGEADGVRVGFSPTGFESLHAAVSPVSSTNAQSADRTFLMVCSPSGKGVPIP
jgi:hypothetical protein